MERGMDNYELDHFNRYYWI